MSSFAVLFCIFLFAGDAAAQVESLGEVSFAVPEGWDYSVEASGDHSNLSIGEKDLASKRGVARAVEDDHLNLSRTVPSRRCRASGADRQP